MKIKPKITVLYISNKFSIILILKTDYTKTNILEKYQNVQSIINISDIENWLIMIHIKVF